MAKISVLCLYRRIFITKSFRRNSSVVIAAVVIYWVASVLGFLTECIPVQGNWDPAVNAHCTNTAALFFGLELYNCVLDVIILCLPLGVIRGLQMPMKQKVAVGMIFLLGSL